MFGKGASMEDGMRAARGEILLFVEANLHEPADELVARMTRPIRNNEADFVKARSSQPAGRVTALTARPLLRIFFPELARFEQPLSGTFAARRALLRELEFESDHGVDIGLLIDAAIAGARIEEVDIGPVQRDTQPLDVLGDLATQVTRTVLDRAARHDRLKADFISEVQEIERHMQSELDIALEKLDKSEHLALLDMEGVLLRGRFVVELAHRLNKGAALSKYLDNDDYTRAERAQRIAALFHGVPRELFEEIARELPLMPGAQETVVALRKGGFRVGIVTESYRLVADIIRRRCFADFCIANVMRFQRGKATGRISLSPALRHPEGCIEHVYCKVNVMRHLQEKMGIGADRVLAVADGENDICLLRAAGQSVAYRPTKSKVRSAAQHVVEGALTDLLGLIHFPRNGAVPRVPER
jgi:phosphoserine phosphatase